VALMMSGTTLNLRGALSLSGSAAALARSADMGGWNFETLTHVSHAEVRRALLENTCSPLYICLLCVIVVSFTCTCGFRTCKIIVHTSFVHAEALRTVNANQAVHTTPHATPRAMGSFHLARTQ
jgi:hypothetical protein